jgi:hypothetical protein
MCACHEETRPRYGPWLRQALAETLAPAGWVPTTPMRESPFALAALVRAAERDELPHVPARLTPRSEAHMLEVQLPATGS